MPLKPIQTGGQPSRQEAEPTTDNRTAGQQKRIGAEAPRITVKAPDVINQAAKFQVNPATVLAREAILTERWRVFWQGLARVSPFARMMAPEAHFPAPADGTITTAVGSTKRLA